MWFELEFVALLLCSIGLPLAIYYFMWKKRSISPLTVLALAAILILLSGIDLLLLQHLAEIVKRTSSLLDDAIFSGQLGMAIYLLPATFAGIGINLVSHVLIRHLERAERRFESSAHPGQ